MIAWWMNTAAIFGLSRKAEIVKAYQEEIGRRKWGINGNNLENRHFLTGFLPFRKSYISVVTRRRERERVPFNISLAWKPRKRKEKKLHASFCFHSGEEEKKLALIQMRTEQPKCITIDLTVVLVVKYYSVFQSRKYLMWWSLTQSTWPLQNRRKIGRNR